MEVDCAFGLSGFRLVVFREQDVIQKEYDPETGEMAYKFVEGKTIWSPFENKHPPRRRQGANPDSLR